MIQAVACVVVPALAMWAAERVKLFKLLGPVVLCYAVGIIAANVPGVHVDQKVAMNLNEGSVALAIPLLLFSTELKKWLGLGWKLLLSFALACVSAVVAAGGVAWLFRSQTDEWWKVAGMLVGVYVGGTANMSAVGLALETKTETFVLLSAADVVGRRSVVARAPHRRAARARQGAAGPSRSRRIARPSNTRARP